MSTVNRTMIILLVLFFYGGGNLAYAQLWRYLNDCPEKEKATDKKLKKEAFSVVTKRTIAYGDTFCYDIMTHVIKSFDGQSVKIRLFEKPFSRHVVHLDLPDEKLVIPDFYALARVHHLSADLLEIVYSPRGGSDDGFDNVLILGVNKNRFCIVMEVQSIHEFDGPEQNGLYNLLLKLRSITINNYQMTLSVRDLVKSDDSTKNYDRKSIFHLKFNNDQHIFYTDNQRLDAYTYEEDNKTKNHHITGLYRFIDLGQYRYCFFNKVWYSVWKEKKTGEISMFSDQTQRN